MGTDSSIPHLEGDADANRIVGRRLVDGDCLGLVAGAVRLIVARSWLDWLAGRHTAPSVRDEFV